MNKKQNGTLSMLRRVLDFILRNLGLVQTLPTFMSLQTEYAATLNEINELAKEQERDISGLTTQKAGLRIVLTQKALDASRRMVACAKITDDGVLAKAGAYTESDLKQMAENNFLTTCNTLFSLVETHMPALIEYGVSPVSQSDFKAAIDAYHTSIDAPKEGYTEKKQVTSQLAELFDKEYVLLTKMDALVEMLKDSQPAFYAEYQDTRKVVYHSGSFSLTGLATDLASGQSVTGAKFSFALEGETVLEKLTAEAGRFNVKSLEAGVYTVTVSKPGYQTQTLTTTVSDTEMTTVEVPLIKN